MAKWSKLYFLSYFILFATLHGALSFCACDFVQNSKLNSLLRHVCQQIEMQPLPNSTFFFFSKMVCLRVFVRTDCLCQTIVYCLPVHLFSPSDFVACSQFTSKFHLWSSVGLRFSWMLRFSQFGGKIGFHNFGALHSLCFLTFERRLSVERAILHHPVLILDVLAPCVFLFVICRAFFRILTHLL